MNLLTFLEGRLSRNLRQRVETMEVLVKVVQRDAKASENRLRASIARARDELDRPPVFARRVVGLVTLNVSGPVEPRISVTAAASKIVPFVSPA